MSLCTHVCVYYYMYIYYKFKCYTYYNTLYIYIHSLGAGVAALLVYMLRDRVPGIRAVVFGCPACVDEVTADALKDRYVIYIILYIYCFIILL